VISNSQYSEIEKAFSEDACRNKLTYQPI